MYDASFEEYWIEGFLLRIQRGGSFGSTHRLADVKA